MRKGIWMLLCCAMLLGTRPAEKEVYLFTSFREPGTTGLCLLWSEDGYHWTDLGCSILTPTVGTGKILRDPSMALGPDGVFHLVWTTGWRGDNGFGYASSRDLLHWSDQQFVDVMKNEPATVNVWAPELYYDRDSAGFIIIWASTIPRRFPRGIEEENNNHRMYMTRTRDFKTFSPARLFFDPGFSVIDAVIVQKERKKWILVLKDNTRPNRNLKVASASRPEGPYSQVSAPFTDTLTEGPTVVQVQGKWLIYFDSYGKKKYEAVSTTDFQHFRDVSSEISIPAGHKHGTILKVPAHVVEELKKRAVPDTR